MSPCILTCDEIPPLLNIRSPLASLVRILNEIAPYRVASHEAEPFKRNQRKQLISQNIKLERYRSTRVPYINASRSGDDYFLIIKNLKFSITMEIYYKHLILERYLNDKSLSHLFEH